jgi:hypothetical protein
MGFGLMGHARKPPFIHLASLVESMTDEELDASIERLLAEREGPPPTGH